MVHYPRCEAKDLGGPLSKKEKRKAKKKQLKRYTESVQDPINDFIN